MDIHPFLLLKGALITIVEPPTQPLKMNNVAGSTRSSREDVSLLGPQIIFEVRTSWRGRKYHLAVRVDGVAESTRSSRENVSLLGPQIISEVRTSWREGDK